MLYMVSCGVAKGRTNEMNRREARGRYIGRPAWFSAQRWRATAPTPPGRRPDASTLLLSLTPVLADRGLCLFGAVRRARVAQGGEHARRDRDRDIPAEDGRHRADAD